MMHPAKPKRIMDAHGGDSHGRVIKPKRYAIDS